MLLDPKLVKQSGGTGQRWRYTYAASSIIQKGSALTPRVNAAVLALISNGTLRRLQRRWLLTDLGSLRVLG